MDKRVREMIEKYEKELEKEAKKEKDDFLIKLGLYEKEYVPMTIVGVGFEPTDYDKKNPISFKTRKNTVNIGSTISIKLTDETVVQIVVDEIKDIENDIVSGKYIDAEEIYTGVMKNYKKIPIDVTDEEYENLKKIYEEDLKYKQNVHKHKEETLDPVGTALSTIGALTYVIGFIAGIIVAEEEAVLMFIWWISAFISGTIFLGFGRIIQLLNKIFLK